MRIPTVHPNGTSRERLLESLCAATDALVRAMEAVAETAPNARDYYPQGPGAHAEAAREHLDRMQRLESVRRELAAIAEAVSDAPDGPRAIIL